MRATTIGKRRERERERESERDIRERIAANQRYMYWFVFMYINSISRDPDFGNSHLERDGVCASGVMKKSLHASSWVSLRSQETCNDCMGGRALTIRPWGGADLGWS